MKPIIEYHEITRDQFVSEIVPLDQPAVFRGLVRDWPIVSESDKSIEDFVAYLQKHDSGNPVYTIVGQPEIEGRFFYSEDLKGVNFKRANVEFSAVVEQISALQGEQRPHAIAIQSAPLAATLPQLAKHHNMPLLSKDIDATMWLGNQAVVAPHYDTSDNLAAVVYGSRTFTLFPPEQVSNLYVGPALESPGGVPISLVDLKNPDLQRWPKFSQALEQAQTATLFPGDVIFMPSPWWHAVESNQPFNMLINYWWSDEAGHGVSPNNSLMHAMMTISNMSEKKRQSWKSFFDYYVFKQSGDASEHLPEGFNDVITQLSSEQLKMLRAFLKSKL